RGANSHNNRNWVGAPDRRRSHHRNGICNTWARAAHGGCNPQKRLPYYTGGHSDVLIHLRNRELAGGHQLLLPRSADTLLMTTINEFLTRARPRSIVSRSSKHVRRHPTVALGALLLTLMVLMAIFASSLQSVDPQAISPATRLQSPSAEHVFGTDMLGRDIYS